MNTWVTVAQAVILTGKSKSVIYDVIRDSTIRTEEHPAGITVYFPDLTAALAKRRRGRPRGTPNQK